MGPGGVLGQGLVCEELAPAYGAGDLRRGEAILSTTSWGGRVDGVGVLI